MSKKRKMQRVTGVMTPKTPQKDTPEWVAMHAKRALDHIAPLVRPERLSPSDALLLAAGVMNFNITGVERYIDVDEVISLCQKMVDAWKAGLFAPVKYPYSLGETLSAMQNDGLKKSLGAMDNGKSKAE